MPTDPFRRSQPDSLQFGPISLGALIGGVVAFVWAGAIVTVLWVLLGLAVGAATGFAVKQIAIRDPLGTGSGDPDPSSPTAQPPAHVLDLDKVYSADDDDLAVLPDGRRTDLPE